MLWLERQLLLMIIKMQVLLLIRLWEDSRNTRSNWILVRKTKRYWLRYYKTKWRNGNTFRSWLRDQIRYWRKSRRKIRNRRRFRNRKGSRNIIRNITRVKELRKWIRLKRCWKIMQMSSLRVTRKRMMNALRKVK